MGEFNQLFTILYKDSFGQIKTVMNKEGGIRLFLTFSKAQEIANELSNEHQDNEYIVHNIEIDRKLFE